jgi:hypothetical protein
MEDSSDQNTIQCLAVEDDVTALLYSSQTFALLAKVTSHSGRLGKKRAKGSDLLEIKISLCFSPSVSRVVVDGL